MKTKLKFSILMMICICAVLLSGCKQFTTIAGRAPSNVHVNPKFSQKVFEN